MLGFREVVARDDPAEVIRAISLMGRFAGIQQTDEQDADDEDERTISFNFSDCVVRVRHFDAEYSMGALHHEILNMVHAQAELVHQGVLVRGGMTTGDIFADGNVVFGPAFNRAYELESQYATFPRIVVGPEAFEMLRADRRLVSDHHDLVDEIHYTRKLLRRGDDGLWYVDYLKAIQEELDEPVTYPDLLDEHRKLILSRLERHGKSARVMHKLLWLAHYHNTVCRDYDPSSPAIVDGGAMPEFEELAERSPHHND